MVFIQLMKSSDQEMRASKSTAEGKFPWRKVLHICFYICDIWIFFPTSHQTGCAIVMSANLQQYSANVAGLWTTTANGTIASRDIWNISLLIEETEYKSQDASNDEKYWRYICSSVWVVRSGAGAFSRCQVQEIDWGLEAMTRLFGRI